MVAAVSTTVLLLSLLPHALHHLLFPEPQYLRRKVEEEESRRGGTQPLPSKCKVPTNLKAVGINFPFINHIVIQATVLPSDILNESATGYARRMMDYGAGAGKTTYKKSAEIDQGSEEHPKMQKDRPASIYVPFTQTVQKHLLSLIHQLLSQVCRGWQGGNQNSPNQEKKKKIQRNPQKSQSKK